MREKTVVYFIFLSCRHHTTKKSQPHSTARNGEQSEKRREKENMNRTTFFERNQCETTFFMLFRWIFVFAVSFTRCQMHCLVLILWPVVFKYFCCCCCCCFFSQSNKSGRCLRNWAYLRRVSVVWCSNRKSSWMRVWLEAVTMSHDINC